MRKIIPYKLALFLLIMLLALPSLCQATPQELKAVDLEWGSDGSLPDTSFKADIFGDGDPVVVHIHSVATDSGEQQNIVFEFYRDNALVARFTQQAYIDDVHSTYYVNLGKLRDDHHEEVIGYGTEGSGFFLQGLVIFGTSSQGKIVSLPWPQFVEGQTPGSVGYPAEVDGHDLLIPDGPYNARMILCWDFNHQAFIVSQESDAPPNPPVPAPAVLSDADTKIGAYTLGDTYFADGGVDDPVSWITTYHYHGMEIDVQDIPGDIHIARIIDVDPAVATARGVRVGDSAAKVVAVYGKPYITAYNNLLLYEYATTGKMSTEGEVFDVPRAVLRFAVNKDTMTVQYISLRYN